MWQDGDTYICPHCGRECIIQRNVPMDLATRKRHSCDQYKKYIKANPKPKSSLSETFANHSQDRGGKMVEVPYPGSGRWVRKKWRDEFKQYMTDEVYECTKNMPLFLAKRQKPMIDYFIPYNKEIFDYKLDTDSEEE
jgi:hypothetical protein